MIRDVVTSLDHIQYAMVEKRHSVFEEKLGIEPTIISPTAWELLANRFEINFWRNSV